MSGENFFRSFGDHPAVKIERTGAMKLVVIESPYAGDREVNDAYLRACLLDSLRRGEAPYASHAIYPQVLDDAKPDERALGMMAGFAWGEQADLVACYVDLGWSSGMLEGARRADAFGKKIENRRIPGWDAVAREIDERRARESDLLAHAVRARASSCWNTAPHSAHGDCPGMAPVTLT